MTYSECMGLLTRLKTEETLLENLVGVIAERIDKLFIASADQKEMEQTLVLLSQIDFEVEEDSIPCANGDYCVYVLDTKGQLQVVPDRTK